MPEIVLSPLESALQRMAKAWPVRIALAILGAYLLMAIYAPFLCNEVALVWSDAKGLRFPILGSLFNANEYPQVYDLAFNILALVLPVGVVLWFALRRRWRPIRRLQCGLAIWAVAMVISLIPWTGKAAYSSRPWTAERAQTEHSADVSAVFTLVRAQANTPYTGAKLLAPGSPNTITGGSHVLGTDNDTEDVLANLIYGARVSLTIGLLATLLSMTIGVIIGAVSGYFGGWVDLILQRFVEIMMCFPTFILVLIVVSILGAKLMWIIMVIGLTGWAGTARLVRGEYLGQAPRDYVTAAQALGVSRARIMFRHILPNILTPLIIGATFGIAGTVFLESGLAFLGLSDPDAPSWGAILEQGRNQPGYRWLIFVPGIAIFILVFTLNVLGTHLREALDPRSTK